MRISPHHEAREHGMKGGERAYWDNLGVSWGSDRQSLWRMHSDMINCALLERWLTEGKVESMLKTDLFDEMCSDGLYPFLAQRARIFVGVDVSQVTSSLARSRHGRILAIAADVRQLPFADGTFDLIISNSTLDHLASRAEIAESLAELFRVLRRGGELIITMDNPTNPFVALRNALPFSLLKRICITPYYVGATCGERSLRVVLERTGFNVLATDTLLHCPRVFAVAIARQLERYASERVQRGFLRMLLAFERLNCLPTRRLTGHFTAARAVKQAHPHA